MVVVDRFKAYAFLKELLQLAYCWAHVRRDFLHLRLGGQEQEAWADGWIERIGQLYKLNAQRLTLAKSQNGPEALPAPFVELDLSPHEQLGLCASRCGRPPGARRHGAAVCPRTGPE
jgi:Transposase IS66 family